MRHDTSDVASPREGMRDVTNRLPREVDELALIYGVEAHRHLGNADWDDVQDRLAAGWPRIRSQRNVDWRQVADRVEAGWRCRSTPDRKSGG